MADPRRISDVVLERALQDLSPRFAASRSGAIPGGLPWSQPSCSSSRPPPPWSIPRPATRSLISSMCEA